MPDQSDPRNYVLVKSVETKVNGLIRELDLVKTSLVKKNDELRKEIKVLTGDLLELRREQEKFTQKIDIVVKELERTAPAEEVQILKKYLEFWNPLNFVSQRDLDRAIEAKVVEKKS